MMIWAKWITAAWLFLVVIFLIYASWHGAWRQMYDKGNLDDLPPLLAVICLAIPAVILGIGWLVDRLRKG